MIDKLLKVDSTKDNLVDQIQDLQERIAELERFALTSQDIVATGIDCSGDIWTVVNTSFVSNSTVVGWTTYATQDMDYKKIGKTVFVNVYITGESDNVATTFTLPDPIASTTAYITVVAHIADDGVVASGLIQAAGGGSIATCYSTVGGAAWTDSGTKRVAGQFRYETD